MFKYWCCIVFLIQLVAGDNKVLGKVLDPSIVPIGPNALPLFGTYLTNQYAKIAREIVHNSNETYLATVSVTKPLKGYPVIDKFQVADSEWNTTSTGDINFYLQKNNPVFANIKKKNEVSAMFSNETRLYNNETEQWEPTGHRVFITGFVAQVPSNTTEGNKTEAAIINRHPDATAVLGRLNTILCKLEIDQVCVVDELRGQFCLTPDDYYNADVDQ